MFLQRLLGWIAGPLMCLEAHSFAFLSQCINGHNWIFLHINLVIYLSKVFSYVVEDVEAELELDLSWAWNGS